jgi:hypothetical protein
MQKITLGEVSMQVSIFWMLIQLLQNDPDNSNKICIGLLIAGALLYILIAAGQSPSLSKRSRKLINSIPLQEIRDIAEEWVCLDDLKKKIEQDVNIAQNKLEELEKSQDKSKQEVLFDEIESQIESGQKHYQVFKDKHDILESLLKRVQKLIEANRTDQYKSDRSKAILATLEMELEATMKTRDYDKTNQSLNDIYLRLNEYTQQLDVITRKTN